MASKRAFLTEQIEEDEPAAAERPFEEPTPEVPGPEVVSVEKKNEKEDRFGPTPTPSGEKFLRKKEKVGKTTDHIQLQAHLKHTRKRDRKAAQRAELLHVLDPADAGRISNVENKIYNQNEILKHADVQTLQKKFELDMDLGPYSIKYDASGRHLLMAGQLGHVAMIDHISKRPQCEFSTKEVISDAVFLQNEKMMAIAQKKWTYVYDNQGVEIHCLKSSNNVNKMVYLPHHFLLSTINAHGYLQYIDISIGKEISMCHTNEHNLNVICSNPSNGVIHLGHGNGTVSLWTPNQKSYIAKMLCHRSNVISTAITPDGNYMATSSQDCSVKLWDLRNWKCVQTHRLPKGAHQMKFSQMGRLATAFGNVVELWKEPWQEACEKPLMRYEAGLVPSSIDFCPFEDVLGIGSKSGFCSIIAPGSGEPNPDSWQYNPFQTKKQRAEIEVRMLLEKCPPETISLDQNILAKLDSDRIAEFDEEKLKRVGFKPDRKFVPRKKQRGKAKSGAKEARKSKMREQELRKTIHKQKKNETFKQKMKQEQASNVLARFMKKEK